MRKIRPLATLSLCLLATAAPGYAAVSGQVLNRTTGQPASGTILTLLSFADGMQPVAEVFAGTDGGFEFDRDISGARTPHAIRAEYEGVSYTRMVPPGTPTTAIEIAVYDLSEDAPPPAAHIVIPEPRGNILSVEETFLYRNVSEPPVTYRDVERGTLRFFLPNAADGKVDVQAVGPAGMPLRNEAVPAGPDGVHKVDFALKPGDNRIQISYQLPFNGTGEIASKVLYDGLVSRVAAPEGVTVTGDGLTSRGVEPQTKAEIFEFARTGPDIRFTVGGQGSLSREPPGSPAPEAPANQIEIKPAPLRDQMWWILGLAAAILALGFARLWLRGRAEA